MPLAAPFANRYMPELDFTEELTPELWWMVELGRTDIAEEVSELSSYLVVPREGHLEALFWIYSYLQYKKNSLMMFDPSYPDIDEDNFPKRDWNNFYEDVEE